MNYWKPYENIIIIITIITSSVQQCGTQICLINKEEWKFFCFCFSEKKFQHYSHAYIFNTFCTNLHPISLQLYLNLI
jgi:hypothetical protein